MSNHPHAYWKFFLKHCLAQTQLKTTLKCIWTSILAPVHWLQPEPIPSSVATHRLQPKPKPWRVTITWLKSLPIAPLASSLSLPQSNQILNSPTNFHLKNYSTTDSVGFTFNIETIWSRREMEVANMLRTLYDTKGKFLIRVLGLMMFNHFTIFLSI